MLLCFSFTLLHAATTNIKFYSERIAIQYNPSIIFDARVKCNDKSIIEYYKQLERASHENLLHDLKRYKLNLRLNDWLYYELIKSTVDKLYGSKSSLQKTLTCWFWLSKSGYDTRLTYLDEEAYLYVHTEDNLFEVPMIEENGRLFVNLTNLDSKKNSYATEVYMLHFIPNRNGNPFSFYLKNLPKLKPEVKNRQLLFRCHGKQYMVKAELDMTIIHLMKHYPIIDEREYLEIPLSNTVSTSIIPQLQQIIKHKPQKEALEILVAFTRSAFRYKEDHEYFGRSKPMIADEVFYYLYSDCEDRSALFYNLVKQLLDLPMIMIAYPDHLTIGVALAQPIGDPIAYRGRKYYVCDPTGPSNSTEIGSVPKSYQQKNFEILAAYK